MKLTVLDTKGEKSGTVTVADEVFDATVNPALVAQAIRVYRANQRQGSAQALTRGEVYGSRRKIWKQKGTGRARHGDRFAPQFVGGGAAHGPTGQENWQRQLNEKMRRKALFAALSQKQREGVLAVVDELAGIEKTRDARRALLGAKYDEKNRTLLVVDGMTASLVRAVRNLQGILLRDARHLNAHIVFAADAVIATKQGVQQIEAHFLTKGERS